MLENCLTLVMALRSMSVAEGMSPFPSKNKSQDRVLTFRQLLGSKKVVRAIL